jgi:hypothetical protein
MIAVITARPRERRRVDLDHAEPLVATVTAEAANRLAASAEQDQRAERRHDPERDETRARAPADPLGGKHHEPSATANKAETTST